MKMFLYRRGFMFNEGGRLLVVGINTPDFHFYIYLLGLRVYLMK